MVLKKQPKSATSPEEITKLTQKVEELEENWKRALADYQNLEKRVHKERARHAVLANVKLIDKLLGVMDDLERAVQELNNQGLAMILAQFKSILESERVTAIDSEGATFNPETMDCVEMVPGPKDIVVKTHSKGYRIDEIVLRPARVSVGKGEAKDEEAPLPS